MNFISIALSGFSIVSALMLLLAYLFFLKAMRKTRAGLVSCMVMLLGLTGLQTAHLIHFIGGTELLQSRFYCVLLAILPVAFLFFSREVLFLNDRFKPKDFLFLLPVPFALVLPLSLVPMVVFAFGSVYTFLIAIKVAKLRGHTGRFRFEIFFFGLFFMMAVAALALGLVLPFLDHSAFYHAYANTISIAMFLVVSALLIFPELLSDLLIITETAYANSRLHNVDLDEKLKEMEHLMRVENRYEDEELSLQSLAEAISLSSHQLSELINTQFGCGFPRYVRELRVEAAKIILIDEPKASVLSVGLSCGFRSQSSFYAAFKEITGSSPGDFRKNK